MTPAQLFWGVCQGSERGGTLVEQWRPCYIYAFTDMMQYTGKKITAMDLMLHSKGEMSFVSSMPLGFRSVSENLIGLIFPTLLSRDVFDELSDFVVYVGHVTSILKPDSTDTLVFVYLTEMPLAGTEEVSYSVSLF